MKIWIYPVTAIAFNIILFNSFHWGEYGGALGALLTVPAIAITSLLFSLIHYRIQKKGKPTKQLQILGLTTIILMSYLLFPSQNSPIAIVKKMAAVAKNKGSLSLNDYFLPNEYENYEIIVAAKKKYTNQLADTAYAVNIVGHYNSTQSYKLYGINFFADLPKPTIPSIKIEQASATSYRFTDYISGDTIIIVGSKSGLVAQKTRTDDYTELGTGHYKDSTLKDIDVEQKLKNQTPDTRYWAYKIFYWLL